jgi:hypothetical protein
MTENKIIERIRPWCHTEYAKLCIFILLEISIQTISIGSFECLRKEVQNSLWALNHGDSVSCAPHLHPNHGLLGVWDCWLLKYKGKFYLIWEYQGNFIVPTSVFWPYSVLRVPSMLVNRLTIKQLHTEGARTVPWLCLGNLNAPHFSCWLSKFPKPPKQKY